MSFSFAESTALFGGSFNPPHRGHTQAVEGLLRNPGVKRIMILPSWGTPLKKVAVTYEQRFEMAKLAFLGMPAVEVSDFEKANQVEYTWQVLEKLSPQISKLAFVIGTDQFAQLDRWGKYPQFLGMCDWIVLLRKPDTLDGVKPVIQKFVENGAITPTGNDDEFKLTQGKRLKFVPTEAMNISSTHLREQLALGKWSDVEKFMSGNVKDYILRNKVYGNGNSN